MQQRRGTSNQWANSNPVLNAGEIGWESDTNQIKIGDGINHWANLSYFVDETTLNTSLDDYVETSLLGVANGVATLNSSGKLESSQVPNIDELAQDAVDAALTAGTGITKTYNDNSNTITIAVDTSIIATKAELAEVSQDSINDALVAGTGISKSYDDNANTITISANNIPNGALANSSITINGNAVSLGGSITLAEPDVTLTNSATFTNKTINLANNTISGTVAQFNTALSDGDFATLAGTETLSNKTLANAIVTGTITAGGGTGTSGQVLQSTGTGVQWATATAGVDEAMIIMGAI
jgi:hypothetical protein